MKEGNSVVALRFTPAYGSKEAALRVALMARVGDPALPAALPIALTRQLPSLAFDRSDLEKRCVESGRQLVSLAMQTFRSAVVPLLLVFFCAPVALGAKIHTVTLGPVRKVPYAPPESSAEKRSEDTTTLKVRGLFVDGAQKEWTVGEVHDVTDRSFVVRRALRLNDALPGEAAKWTWQPGPWLMVDRTTGRVSALHLPAFDPAVSDVAWFRDYAAYCGIATTVKGGLVAVVAQLGARKAVAQKVLSKWPLTPAPHPACGTVTWQRAPMRATITPTGGEAVTFNVVGTSSLVEDGDEEQ